MRDRGAWGRRRVGYSFSPFYWPGWGSGALARPLLPVGVQRGSEPSRPPAQDEACRDAKCLDKSRWFILNRKGVTIKKAIKSMVSHTKAEPVNVFDVAEYILQKQGAMTTMKLQKLVYYSQAWALVWDEKPLFPERILAWANGPVVYELFKPFQGAFEISTTGRGNPARLKKYQEETICGVLNYYGKRPSQWLSDLTHMEAPWKNARKGLKENERGTKEISLASLAEYYGSLQPSK